MLDHLDEEARALIAEAVWADIVRKARLRMTTVESHKGTRFKSPHALKAGIELPAWM